MNNEEIIRLHLGSVHKVNNWVDLKDPIFWHNSRHRHTWTDHDHDQHDYKFDLGIAMKEHEAHLEFKRKEENRAQKESVHLFTDKERQLLGELVSNVLFLADRGRIPKYDGRRKNNEYIEDITTTNGVWLRRVLNNLAKEVNSKDKD